MPSKPSLRVVTAAAPAAFDTSPVLAALVKSWMRSLRSENVSPRTEQTYCQSLDRFTVYLKANRSVVGDTGARRSEVAGLRYNSSGGAENDVDLDQQIVRVTGKGNRQRILPLGRKAVRSLDRYLRTRSQHPHAQLPSLWLAPRG